MFQNLLFLAELGGGEEGFLPLSVLGKKKDVSGHPKLNVNG